MGGPAADPPNDGRSTDCLIELGSNIDPGANLPESVRRIREICEVTAVSPAYESAAVGRTDQAAFLNAAVRLLWDGTVEALKARLLDIEAEMGRVRDPADKCGPRTIDLDIALFGDRVGEYDGRPLPDPDIVKRAFIATPLADVAGGVILPGDGRTLREVADAIGDETLALRADVLPGGAC